MTARRRNAMGGTIAGRRVSAGCGPPSRTNVRAYLLFLFFRYGSITC